MSQQIDLFAKPERAFRRVQCANAKCGREIVISDPKPPSDRLSPCQDGDRIITDEYMRGKTMHEWCQAHKVAALIDGQRVPCDCWCHSPQLCWGCAIEAKHGAGS